MAMAQGKLPSFQTLWKNHPNITGEGHPIRNEKEFDNQCAIELYKDLEDSGVDVSGYPGTVVKYGGRHYALRATEVAQWLDSARSGMPKTQKYKGDETKNIFSTLSGKTGIIFFRHYWGVNHQGNHIDLWDGSKLTARFSSWIRVHFGIVIDGLWSDYRGAEEIWFWPIP
jgi:hypothetical protein